MLRIDRSNGRLIDMPQPALESGSLGGRRLDDLIASSPDAFFRELRRPLILLGRVRDFDQRHRRTADFLAAETSGRVVVLSVQEAGAGAPDLVEALETAEKAAGWTAADLLARLSGDRADAVRGFLRPALGGLNQTQGVLLAAESFDQDTLATATWLRERYGVRADCVRVSLATDRKTGDEYLLVDNPSAEPATAEIVPAGPAEPAGAWPETTPDISDAPAAAPDHEPVAEPSTLAPPPEPAAPAEGPPDWEREFQAAIADEIAPRSHNGATEDALTEDPLAEIIEARDAAEGEVSAEEREDDQERRQAERSAEYRARRLRLNYFGRLLGARLVDYSKIGLGVEALSPLPVGAEIGVSGELVSDERVISLEGRARVRHCSSSRDGVCRIGFSLDPEAAKEHADPETFKRR